MSFRGLRVTAIAGGVGAARMLRGLAAVTGEDSLTAVVNTGDDTVLHGLYVCPDLDTITYTLGGAANPATGWGIEGETWAVMEALGHFERLGLPGAGSLTWFSLGDRDLATHLFRTGRLAAGVPLSQVASEVAARFGVAARLLPMSDDPVRTMVTLAQGTPVPSFGGLGRTAAPGAYGGPGTHHGTASAHDGAGAPAEVGFQEYFVGLHHSVQVAGLRFAGAERARPAPGVIEAIEQADVVVVCPSNPLVSIGPVLAVPGIARAVAARRRSVVAVSPIVAGRALKGPADRMLSELGSEASVAGVARLWSDIASTLVIDEADAALGPQVEQAGMACAVTGTVMSGPDESARLAEVVLTAASGTASSGGR